MAKNDDIWGGKLAGTQLVLYLDYSTLPKESREARALVEEVKEAYRIGEIAVCDLNGDSLGEPLPYMVTELGLFRGLDQIRYFADRARLWESQATSVA